MVHGLVDLPFGNPTFPWPNREAIVDAWIERFRASVRRPTRSVRQ